MLSTKAVCAATARPSLSGATLRAYSGVTAPRFAVRLRATNPEGGEDISDFMKADLERFKARASATATQQPASGKVPSTPAPTQQPEKQESGGLKETIDKILIADFFLVLAIMGWLAAGVAQSALSGGTSTQLLDIWYPLWPLLWQPAIGVLMSGALVSGGLNWLQEQKEKSK